MKRAIHIFITSFCFFLSFTSFISSEVTLEERFDHVLKQLPGYQPGRVSVEPHPLGATNYNYIITMPRHRYFMRCSSEEAARMGADLEQEYLCSSIAAKENLAPGITLYLPEDQILVNRYIEPARPFDPSDFTLVRQLAKQVRHLHSLPVTFDRHFCPFERIEYYCNLAKQEGVEFPDFVTDIMLPAIERIEPLLRHPEKLCPCHLDLHRKNLINDGKQVWMVDWEFAAMADPYFDLATFAAISLYGDQEMKFLLDAYLGGATEKELAYFDLMRIVNDTHWTLWNYIQFFLSPHDRPYDVWAAEFYDDGLIRIQRPAFEDHLIQVSE